MRYAVGIILAPAAAPLLAAQFPSKANNSPSVSILLPADIPSETVQIRYFMTGPFGGYGGYAGPKPDLDSFRITARAEGQPATAIKILVYATGCDFKTFDLSLSKNLSLQESFVCAALPKVFLSGTLPSELMEGHNAELVITCLANWANDFFGIMDGMVPEFQVATISPDKNGAFQLELPDFSAGTTMSSYRYRADLRLRLRDCKTWNPIVLNLAPEVPKLKSESGGLKIQASYPANVRFVPDSQ